MTPALAVDSKTAAGGEEYAAYNRRRWGGDGWTRSLREAGRREGCAFAQWLTWPNTAHANRLLILAESQGLGGACKDALFRMCYEDGENVSLRETVAKAAAEVGIDGGEAHVMGDDGSRALAAALRGANVNGRRVSSVPTFSVSGGRHVVSGAQTTEYWRRLIASLADARGASDDAGGDDAGGCRE